MLNTYAPTILHTPVPIDAPSRQTQWRVALNGSAADPPLTFVFNDGVNASSARVGGRDFAMAGRSCRIFDSALQPLWYSQPDRPDGEGQPYLPAPTGPLPTGQG